MVLYAAILTLRTKCDHYLVSRDRGSQAGLAGRSAPEINVFIVALDITSPDWHAVNLYKIKLRPARPGEGEETKPGRALFVTD